MNKLVKLATEAHIASWGRTQKIFGQLALGVITLDEAEAAVSVLVAEKLGRTTVAA